MSESTWETNENSLVRIERLKLLSPESVFAELKGYGAYLRQYQPTGWGYDEDLERALLARGDRLIDLGLALYGGHADVNSRLYQRARAGTGDPTFDRAVRVACLGNAHVKDLIEMRPSIGDEGGTTEAWRFLREGCGEEARALLGNPMCRGLLRALIKTIADNKGEVPGVAQGALQSAVSQMSLNPGLNRDEDDESGPDMTGYCLHKAIWRLLVEVPATGDWLRALHDMLLKLDPGVVMNPAMNEAGKAELEAVLARWADTRTERMFGPRKGEPEDEEGFYTGMSLADEFRCLLGALYGKELADGASQSISRRAAHYASAKLDRKAFDVASEKDHDVFVLAVLFNNHLLLDKELRPLVENSVDRERHWIYMARCAQLHTRWGWFNPQPVSEQLTEMAAELNPPEETRPAPATALQLRELDGRLTLVQQKAASFHRDLLWAVVIIVGVIIWVH